MQKPKLVLPEKKSFEMHMLDAMIITIVSLGVGLVAGVVYCLIYGDNAPYTELVFFGPAMWAPFVYIGRSSFCYWRESFKLERQYKKDSLAYNNHVQNERLASQRNDANRWAKEIKSSRGRYEI